MLPLDRQNAYRARYQRLRPGWQPSGPLLEALVRRLLTPGSRVLDLGAGRGGVMELFWPQAARAVALDADLASLREHRAGGILRANGLGEALPFAPGSFDLVLALWVLEHLAQPERALAEVCRVLAAGGHFVFLTPNARHPLLLANRLSQAFPAVQRRLVPRLYGRPEADTFRVQYRANHPARLRQLAAAAGFRQASLQIIPDPTYLAFNDLAFRLSTWLERLLPPGAGIHLLGHWTK